MAALKQEILTFYNQQAELYGADELPRLGWSSWQAQQTRFAALMDVGPLADRSILDVGCGVGDLYEYLTRQGLSISYTGYDLVARNCQDGARRHPAATFLTTDVLETTEAEAFDYVLASGIFTFTGDDWHGTVGATLRRMYELCRVGFAANFLSSYSPSRIDKLFYVDPAEIVGMCQQLTNSFKLRHDYMENDFTVFGYRPLAAGSGGS